MLRRLITSGLIFAVLTLWILAALGESIYGQSVAEITVESGKFKESYDSAVPVSGSTIVGVRLGEAKGNVTVGDTQLALVTAINICVRVVTRDGRFSANNIYKLSNPLSDVDRVRLSPVTLNYAEVLSNYKLDDLAVSAFAARDGACLSSEAAFLPHLVSQQRPWRYLTILVNSSARYSVLLLEEKRKKVLCQRISQGPLIAYDQKCQINTALLSEGKNDFTLIMDDGFGEEVIHFTVMLPSTAQ